MRWRYLIFFGRAIAPARFRMSYDFTFRQVVGIWGEPAEWTFDVVLVDEDTLVKTQEFVSACEHCAENADITFDYLLDEITGCDPATNYLMCRPANCPSCLRELTEKSLVVAGRA
jgi:hypothetical protein